jgi:preprotein translocase SecE subunit
VATKKDQKPQATEKKPKRILRAAPTLREQTAKSTADAKPTKVSKVSKTFAMPFKIVGKAVQRVVLAIAQSPIGAAATFIWGSALFIPVRFIVRILAKVLLVRYFMQSFQELKLVTWPDARTTARLTFAVTMFAVIFGLIVAGMDFVFEKLFREVIL